MYYYMYYSFLTRRVNSLLTQLLEGVRACYNVVISVLIQHITRVPVSEITIVRYGEELLEYCNVCN